MAKATSRSVKAVVEIFSRQEAEQSKRRKTCYNKASKNKMMSYYNKE